VTPAGREAELIRLWRHRAAIAAGGVQ
jgi:hypothetical protein